MKQIFLAFSIFLATLVPAVAADTTDRAESVPDANPACMERNGPDCVLKSQVLPRRVAAPPGFTPADTSGVVVIPAPGSATSPGVVVVPPPGDTASVRGTANPQGMVGNPAPASPATPAPGGSSVLAPSGQGSTVISPRR